MILLYAITHSTPSDTFVTPDGQTHTTQWYVEQALAGKQFAIDLLASANIVPYYPLAETEKPCGSTWEQRADGWHEVASGTEAERAAALEAQAAAAQLEIDRQAWEKTSAVLTLQEIDSVLADQDSSTDQKFAAMRKLIGA